MGTLMRVASVLCFLCEQQSEMLRKVAGLNGDEAGPGSFRIVVIIGMRGKKFVWVPSLRPAHDPHVVGSSGSGSGSGSVSDGVDVASTVTAGESAAPVSMPSALPSRADIAAFVAAAHLGTGEGIGLRVVPPPLC
jgi:hypothetical protein